MLNAYQAQGTRLVRLEEGQPLAAAGWIDLYRPEPEEVAAVTALGVSVPSPEDMDEIEISSRLYREEGVEYLTVVLPGREPDGRYASGPVCFILAPDRILTVRHLASRPFETYPNRAEQAAPGCGTPERIFLSLIEEVTGRLADFLEASGRVLDALAREAYGEAPVPTEALRDALRRVGREGEQIARVRLALLTVERALSYFGQTLQARDEGATLRGLVKAVMRDIQALEVHADFLSARVAQATDATLGAINLAQNQTIRTVSVVAAVFLPPTLIASVYGMNFALMPELGWRWGYPMALALMVASAVGTFLFFRWKRWF